MCLSKLRQHTLLVSRRQNNELIQTETLKSAGVVSAIIEGPGGKAVRDKARGLRRGGRTPSSSTAVTTHPTQQPKPNTVVREHAPCGADMLRRDIIQQKSRRFRG